MQALTEVADLFIWGCLDRVNRWKKNTLDEIIDKKLSTEDHEYSKDVSDKGKIKITSIDIPIKSLALFMIKWAIATIPAFMLLFLFGLIFSSIISPLFY